MEADADWKDVSLYQPAWQESPMPFQSDDPEAPPVHRGFPDDDEGILEDADNVEDPDDGMGLGLTGIGGPPASPAPPTTSPPTTLPPTTAPPTTTLPPTTLPPTTTPPP